MSSYNSCIVCFRPIQESSGDIHFCSANCRNYYLSKNRSIAGLIAIVVILLILSGRSTGVVILILVIIAVVMAFSPNKPNQMGNFRFLSSSQNDKFLYPNVLNNSVRMNYQSVTPYPDNHNQSASVTFTKEVTVLACCYQTMRLSETYCPCGRSVNL